MKYKYDQKLATSKKCGTPKMYLWLRVRLLEYKSSQLGIYMKYSSIRIDDARIGFKKLETAETKFMILDSGKLAYGLIAVGFLGGIIDNEFQIYCLLLLFFGIILVMMQDSSALEKGFRRQESNDTLVD